MIFMAFASMVLTSAAQGSAYKILSECDTTIYAIVEGITLGSRDVHHIVYEYPSKDFEGEKITISGVIDVPSNVYDGSAPCDGVILYNHYAESTTTGAPSIQGEEVPNGILGSPLKPNYILVISDYIGFGSSADRPQAFLCGNVNARNSLDGLLAARQLFEDRQIPQGKYLFNVGFSQGGTETMQVAKLRDMEYKDLGVTFDKTFAGGGPCDFERCYTEMVKAGSSDFVVGIVLLMVSVNENYHLGLDYSQVFQEPLASHIQDWILDKKYSKQDVNELVGTDSLKYILQPDYMDIDSEAARAFRAKLREMNLDNGWEPDLSQKYFILHSRHDRYVPIQSVRCIIPWMKNKGFTSSIVPGKTGLQTNTMLFKLNHGVAGAIWFVQTAAALQAWPVLYYEGEQNRYYRDAVKDLNLMKVIKTLESVGIDLRKIIASQQSSSSVETDYRESVLEGSLDPKGSIRQLASTRRASLFDILDEASKYLSYVDLTLTDALEMLDDAGITLLDLMEVYTYLTTEPSESTSQAAMRSLVVGDDVSSAANELHSPTDLLRLYETTLANWLLQAGVNVEYEKWGR